MASLSKLLLPILKSAQKEPTKVACIGTRKLSKEDQEFCFRVGLFFAGHGLFVGSGNAQGADQAYLRGVNSAAPWRGILYLPWDGFETTQVRSGNHLRCEPYPEDYRERVRALHPNPDALSQRAWKLMIRNVAILDKSKVCVAWPGETGGTKFGMALAEEMKIPLIDLSDEKQKSALKHTMDTWP